jgi:hypothetical protein
MRHDAATMALIERIAQDWLKYELLFTEQTKVLQTDQARSNAAQAKVLQSPLLAKPGQHWQPAADKVDEYLAHCDEMCQLVPQDFEELSL